MGPTYTGAIRTVCLDVAGPAGTLQKAVPEGTGGGDGVANAEVAEAQT